MTCIAGLVHEGKVYMGADSAGVGGMDLAVRADKKIFVNGKFLIGFTSSFRMGQLLEHKLTPPKHHPDDDVFAFMVKDFVEAVRECLKAGGVASKEKEAEAGGTFLVGYAGRLFSIQDDYQVSERVLPFDACGCGESFALGSFWETGRDGMKLTPEERVSSALYAAEKFSAGVRGPFHIQSIG